MKSLALRNGPALRGLLAVTVAIAALLAIALPLYFDSVEKSREAVLRQSLQVTRDAIDGFYTDNARYPEALGDLVEKRYLRAVPVDPITDSADTWVLVAPPEGTSVRGKVFDVKSGAKGKTRDGVEFADL
jgi:general secretion pathway protein G